MKPRAASGAAAKVDTAAEYTLTTCTSGASVAGELHARRADQLGRLRQAEASPLPTPRRGRRPCRFS